MPQSFRYDVAFDTVNHVYLLVWDHSPVTGQLADTNGVPFGPRFTIASEASLYTSWSSVSFGGPAGDPAFLVTYLSMDATNVVRKYARLVRVSNGTVSVSGRSLVTQTFGTDYLAADQSRSVWDANGNHFITSTKVTPPGSPVPIPQIQSVDMTGAVSGPVQLGDGLDYEAGPAVACAPDDVCLVIGFARGDPFGAQGGIWARRFNGVSLQPIGGVFYIDDHSSRMDTPHLTYNSKTGQFQAVWFRQGPTNAGYADFRVINEDSSMGPLDLSRSFGTGVGDFGWAFNPATGTTAFVTKWTGAADLYEMEVGDQGYPITSPVLIRRYVCCWPTYSTEMTAGENGKWLTAFMMTPAGFAVSLQGVVTNGGAPPPPPPPGSRPMISVDTPANNATVPVTGFVVAGWAADAGASSGTGVDVVAVWAWPNNGGPAILGGVATYGFNRPDVGNFLGPQFTLTGYGLITTLPAGGYTLSVYAHSTVNNSWNTPTLVKVTVAAAASHPLMWVDTPTAGQTLIQSQTFTIGGWAVDLASTSGPGVDLVHVYVYLPNGTAIFLGAASTGGARPDVANAFGGTQFATSGFFLNAALAPGNYTLVVFAHSTVTGTFNNVQAIGITVR